MGLILEKTISAMNRHSAFCKACSNKKLFQIHKIKLKHIKHAEASAEVIVTISKKQVLTIEETLLLGLAHLLHRHTS